MSSSHFPLFSSLIEEKLQCKLELSNQNKHKSKESNH